MNIRQQTGLPGSVGLARGQAGKESSPQLRMLETPCQHLSLLAGFPAPDIQVRKQPTSTASLDKLFPITSLLFWISWRRFAPALHYVPDLSAFIMWTHCETDAQSRLVASAAGTSFCSVVVRACSSGASVACILFGLVACHSTHAMQTETASSCPTAVCNTTCPAEPFLTISPSVLRDLDRQANAAKESMLPGYAGKHSSRRREIVGAPSRGSASPNLAPTMRAIHCIGYCTGRLPALRD